MEVKGEYIGVLVLIIIFTLGTHLTTGTREVTGLVVSTSYSSRLYPHTLVTFVIYTPEGVILEDTFKHVYSGYLELELGCVYRIKTHKEFFQLWRVPVEVELVHRLQGTPNEVKK